MRELELRSSAAAATAAQKVLEEQIEASMAHTAQQVCVCVCVCVCVWAGGRVCVCVLVCVCGLVGGSRVTATNSISLLKFNFTFEVQFHF